MKIGNSLRNLLEQHNMTQKQLAEKLSITSGALGNYIRNVREPDYNTLIQIADYFHVSIDYLLDHQIHSDITHEEETLLNIFRSLTPEQKEFYIEQGKIFIKQNKRKLPVEVDL